MSKHQIAILLHLLSMIDNFVPISLQVLSVLSKEKNPTLNGQNGRWKKNQRRCGICVWISNTTGCIYGKFAVYFVLKTVQNIKQFEDNVIFTYFSSIEEKTLFSSASKNDPNALGWFQLNRRVRNIKQRSRYQVTTRSGQVQYIDLNYLIIKWRSVTLRQNK